MARFILVRGWLECAFDDVPAIARAVDAFCERGAAYGVPEARVTLYRRGWAFPSAPLNWVSLIFFGADIEQTALDYVRDQLLAAAAAGSEVAGLFHVDDEENERPLLWRIEGGRLLETARGAGA